MLTLKTPYHPLPKPSTMLNADLEQSHNMNQLLLHNAPLNEEIGEKMKLQLIFLLMDILMLIACGYFWLKTAVVHALRPHLKQPNHD